MRFSRHTTVCLVIMVLAFGTVLVTAQDYQAQIETLKAKTQALYKQMEEAPNTDAYNAALEDYNKVKAELETLVNKVTSEQNQEAQAKISLNKGLSLLKSSQWEMAVQEFDKAIEIDPKYQKAYYMKGYALTKIKSYPDAIVAYEKALELDSKDAKVIFALGKLYEAQGEGKKAITLYESALAADPQNSKAAYSAGGVYMSWQAYSEAAAWFSKAASIDSTYALAYTGWGTTLIELGKVNDAIAKLQKSIELDAKNDDTYYRLAKAYNAAGNYSSSLEAAEKAIELARTSRKAKAAGNIEKGNALEGLGKKAEAVAAFQEAAKLDKVWKEWVDYHIEKM